MARRSPMNNRYQKGTEPKGVTRKSAASAKPKRSVGESKTPSKADKKKSTKTKSALLRPMPDTEEYRQNRKMWWYFLGAALVLLLLSLGLGVEAVYSALGLNEQTAQAVGFPMTVMAMMCVGAAWYIDFKKIRPLMRDFNAQAGSKKDKKDKAEKADKADKKDKAEKSDKNAKEDK